MLRRTLAGCFFLAGMIAPVPRGGKGWKRVEVRYQRLAKESLTR